MKKKLFIAGLLILSSLAKGEEGVVKLSESVITSENTGATIRNTPKSITIITEKEINERGVKTIGEALELTSSVVVKKIGEEPTFDLRGFGDTASSNILVLINGAPINSIDMSGYQTNNIPVHNIERIEIIPSGGGVLYGDGATAGTINIVIKSPENMVNYGSIGAEVDSYGMYKGEVLYGTKVWENLFIEVDYLKKDSEGYRDYSDETMDNFGLKTSYNFENGKLDLKYNYSKNEFKLPGSLSEKQVEEDRTQTSLSLMDGEREKNSFTSNFIYNITDEVEFRVISSYSNSDYKSVNDYYGNVYDYSYDTEIAYIKPQIKYTYLDNSYIVVGGDYYKGETEVENSGISKKESLGGYIINSYTISEFVFTQGYRRQNIDYTHSLGNFDEKIFKEDSIELTGNYIYSDTGTVYLGYTKGFRTPNTDELGYWAGDFEAQETKTYEIGVKDYIGNTYISASLFHIETENEIWYDPSGGVYGYGANTNLDGMTKRTGIEFGLEHNFDKLTVSESVTYLDTEYKDEKYIPGVSKFKAVLNLNYKFNEKLSINNVWEYYGDSYKSGDIKNEFEKVDAYLLVGMAAKYKFKNGLELNVGVANLFDEEYYEYVGYDSWNGEYYYPAPERNYYLGLKYNF